MDSLLQEQEASMTDMLAPELLMMDTLPPLLPGPATIITWVVTPQESLVSPDRMEQLERTIKRYQLTRRLYKAMYKWEFGTVHYGVGNIWGEAKGEHTDNEVLRTANRN